ncbi:MAG: lipoate--protein ligase family protein, partial [Candidatus Hydrogenedentes bacterium]|nr:lipoate--protein ligase family protein [Candidatus Hydrogenedentota bacterium]
MTGPVLRWLDFTFDDPALNLALEEVLLEDVERGAPDVLRIWESPSRFVVLGSGQVLAQEVIEENCLRDGVPVLRRCTAGGCVLQAPGCLNYTLALRYEHFPETRALHSSYCFILGCLRNALMPAGLMLVHQGACGLTLGDLKVSGNAQRRKRQALMHHGTLLYKSDTAGMERY